MEEKIQNILNESGQLKHKCAQELAGEIVCIVALFVQTLRSGHKILLFGNGGSAADAQHIAGELVNRFLYDRKALAAIALSTDTSVLTCIANDSDYSHIFSRQIEALGVAGDLAVGITTSGNSPNVLNALETAKKMGLKTIGFSGGNGGRLTEIADCSLIVPSKVIPRIQEVHITIAHIICELVEAELCPCNK